MSQTKSGKSKTTDYDILKQRENIRCTLVGDAKVGKTSMLLSYHANNFSDEYNPTTFDSFSKKVSYNDSPVNLLLYDTGGCNEPSQLGPVGIDIFLLCFAVDNHESYENIKEKWNPSIQKSYMTQYICELQSSNIDDGSSTQCNEIKCSIKKPIIMLVGCKGDKKFLKDIAYRRKSAQAKTSLISLQQGEKLAKEIGACKYMECCARNGTGVEEIFNEGIKAVLNKRENNSEAR